MTLIDRLSKLDGPDREAELLRMYQDEKQRADSMSDDWVNFCNYIGIDLDTQEVVAEAINIARHKDHREYEEMKATLVDARAIISCFVKPEQCCSRGDHVFSALDTHNRIASLLRAKEARHGE